MANPNVAFVAPACAFAIGFCLAVAAPPADAARTKVMPVSEIKVGMKGYAVTVFKGQQSDRFEIEVVDTIRSTSCQSCKSNQARSRARPSSIEIRGS